LDPAVAAALGSWTLEPWLALQLALVVWVYVRGWRRLQHRHPLSFPPWRLTAFLCGVATLYVAIASPLDALGGLLLQAHMLQHLLLMLVAPPLLWLGSPTIALLQGLPRRGLKHGLGPFLAWPGLQRAARALAHPAFTWPAFVLTTWIWHAPPLYELALRSALWHTVEHLCFLVTGLLFWFPVVQSWPTRPVWPRAAMIPYLALAGVANTLFCGVFAFADRVIYPSYAAAPRLWGVSALADQAAAGAIMWVSGSLVVLVALVIVVVAVLESPGIRPGVDTPRTRPRARAPQGTGDVLRIPLLGSLLRSQRFRLAAQLATFGLALAIVADGFLGPPQSPLNLAGVLPWTYWRGLVVIGLLAAGNLFCMVCPFTLPRGLARRLLPRRRPWPAALRSKWLAIVLLLLFLWAYEIFDLWDSPYWTAWVVVGYFAAAFGVDVFFQNASFCKYVCPIGQFDFLHSTLSPLEVQVRDPLVCATCATRDCLRGNERRRGCELDLFQPAKLGNLDCTFCLDCARACPVDNVGLLTVAPGLELLSDAPRSGVGRLSKRPDLAALAAVLVFGAFANAAAMVAPVARGEAAVARAIGLSSTGLVTTGLLLGALVLLPWALALALGRASAALGSVTGRRRELSRRMLFALVPLGFSMWLAHFVFHFATARGSLGPALERSAAALRGAAVGDTSHTMVSVSGAAATLLHCELVALGLGLLLSLYILWRIAHEVSSQPLACAAPWAGLAAALYAVGVWTLFQPMEMRGMM